MLSCAATAVIAARRPTIDDRALMLRGRKYMQVGPKVGTGIHFVPAVVT